MKSIPFFDLKEQNQKLKSDLDRAIQQVISETSFILGKEVANFEKNFASFTGTRYAIGVNSGLDALVLAIRALGLKENNEVLLPAHTFIATALGVSWAGAKPVFVDVDPDYCLLDLSKAKKALTKNTKAILPVHLYGQPAPMNEILNFAKENQLFVIEDAAQAHGASIHGKKCGSFGDLGCFSFYPSKNLGAFGDGGIITTDREDLYEKISSLRNYGSKIKYQHDLKGMNSRLDNLQAALLDIKLKYLSDWNAKRRALAKIYSEELINVKALRLPKDRPGFESVYHLYVILTERRDELKDFLEKQGMHTGIHYPVPMHLQKAYQDLNYKAGDFPVAEKIAKNCLSLPFYPELPAEDVKTVCQAIQKFFQK